MNKQLNQLFLALALTSGLVGMTDSVLAQVQTIDIGLDGREESAGSFGGAIIGAAAGGPPGLLVGALVGTFIGNSWEARSNYRELQTDWVRLQLEAEHFKELAAILEAEKLIAQRELQAMRNVPETLPVFLHNTGHYPWFDNTSLSVHFRTGSYELETHYEEQLTSLAQLASQLPDSVLEIAGYADRIGESEKNQMLSLQRSNVVRDFILGLGLPTSEITTVAYGESKPLHAMQGAETDFYDRRVTVRLIDTNKQLLTHGQ